MKKANYKNRRELKKIYDSLIDVKPTLRKYSCEADIKNGLIRFIIPVCPNEISDKIYEGMSICGYDSGCIEISDVSSGKSAYISYLQIEKTNGNNFNKTV